LCSARREVTAKIKRVAKGGGAKRYLPLRTQPVEQWLRQRRQRQSDRDAGADAEQAQGGEEEEQERVPVIALETAAGAVNLCDFRFPESCEIMVGAEGTGISPAVISALEPGRGDAVVYVPLPGVYHSLNVATALAIALYEYRRQWPGGDTTVKASRAP
jgi:tRNA(Leu) C34 or U34 (ribose-2'-O)-methylase TrmL